MNLASISYGSSRDERQWQGTPSQRLLDMMESHQRLNHELSEFDKLLRVTDLIDEKDKKQIWFVNKERG
jgi:hypothetical protein